MTDINKIVPRNGYLVDGETGEKVLFYECDPMKNTECERKLCRAEADEDEGSFGFCSKTLDPRFRKDGGIRSAAPGNRQQKMEREISPEMSPLSLCCAATVAASALNAKDDATGMPSNSTTNLNPTP